MVSTAYGVRTREKPVSFLFLCLSCSYWRKIKHFNTMQEVSFWSVVFQTQWDVRLFVLPTLFHVFLFLFNTPFISFNFLHSETCNEVGTVRLWLYWQIRIIHIFFYYILLLFTLVVLLIIYSFGSIFAVVKFLWWTSEMQFFFFLNTFFFFLFQIKTKWVHANDYRNKLTKFLFIVNCACYVCSHNLIRIT